MDTGVATAVQRCAGAHHPRTRISSRFIQFAVEVYGNTISIPIPSHSHWSIPIHILVY